MVLMPVIQELLNNKESQASENHSLKVGDGSGAYNLHAFLEK